MTRTLMLLIAASALNVTPSTSAADSCHQTLLFHGADGAAMTLCAGEKDFVSAVQGSLNGEWIVVELDGKVFSPTSSETPSLTFSAEEKRASGSTGCNRFSGTYKLDGDHLSFGPLATTSRACPDSAGDSEIAFERALGSTAKYRVTESALDLLDSDGAVLARFSRGAKKN